MKSQVELVRVLWVNDSDSDYGLSIRRPPGLGRSTVHTVDVGPTAGAEQATHTTRGGLPMSVWYTKDLGYNVAVHTP